MAKEHLKFAQFATEMFENFGTDLSFPMVIDVAVTKHFWVGLDRSMQGDPATNATLPWKLYFRTFC